MSRLLDQLYQTKLQLIAVVSSIGGILLLILAHSASQHVAPAWLTVVPLSELGSTLFGTGLLAVFFEYVDRKHGDERAEQRVRKAVRTEAPAIRDAVLDSFAFNPTALKDVASDETLDRIATNALGLRLDDQALARDVYADIRDQVVRAVERWHDVDVTISLAPWEDGPASGPGSMFVATVRWSYRVRPTMPTLRFACLSDPDDYRAMLQDQSVSLGWYFGRNSGLDASSREAFELLKFTVDGKPRTIRRSHRKGAQAYSVSMANLLDADMPVTVAYTYRVLVQRHGHLLYLDVPRPANGLRVNLDYDGCGIRRVNALDFIASSKLPRLELAPEATPAKTVDISFDGWMFPRSGVAFVWVLDDELPSMHRSRTKQQAVAAPD